MSEKVRLSVNVTPREMDALRGHGTTLTRAVESAVTRLVLIDGAQERGAAIKIREADGTIREVVFVT